MALASGFHLGSYEILAPIGAGGMGEVYKARDLRLNRVVALKLLPAGAANDTERRERFEREAQAVAALNHPGIVTIHSVEQADGNFFLTMELVEGRSLADGMPSTGLPLDRLLKIAIAVADAIAAAHQKGITHRDLKPANIMLGEGEHGGRVKVLDFGLAKLAEVPAADAAATAMPTAPITGEGRILGTVAYMSPEQAEGRAIDARSDLFSLGVILYEMATGRRPFTGDTSISIISSIVKDTPKSVTELNPALPRDLGRIIRRALTKDLDRRYQTAKDLRNDLEELKTSLDSGELQTASMTSSSALVETHQAASRHRGMAIVAGVVGLALAGGIVYLLTTGRADSAGSYTSGPSLQDLQITQLTTSGIARRPTISPDGKYVAYVQQSQVPGPRGALVPASSVWIRQIATSSNVQIVAPEAREVILGLTITPDGNYVDYVRGPIPSTTLWRVPLLGGTPKKLLDNVDTPVGWSPDGRRIAFVRTTLGRGTSELVVAEADGGNPRVLATRNRPAQFASVTLVPRPSVRPAWSPDGRVIAIPGILREPTFQAQIVYVDSATGAEHARPIEGSLVFGLEWLDGDSLLLDRDVEDGTPSQLWRLAYQSGTVTRLTNDLTHYVDLNLTAARDSLVTTRTERRVAIFVSDGSGSHVKEVVSATPSSGATDAVEWAADRLLFTNLIGGQRSISSVGWDGESRQDLVTQGIGPGATSDGKTVVFSSTDPSRRGLWKISDGGRPAQLSSVSGFGKHRVTRDDRSVVFESSAGNLQSLWMLSIEGGTPTQIANRYASRPILSPDGKAVAFGTIDEHGRSRYAICNLPDCSSLRLVPELADARAFRFAWTPDNAGFLYATGTPQNLWVQSLNGKPDRQLTHFTDDREIADAAWSRDGKRLAIARATTTTDIVLIKGLKR